MDYPNFVKESDICYMIFGRTSFFDPRRGKNIELTDVDIYLRVIKPKYAYIRIFGHDYFGILWYYPYEFGEAKQWGYYVKANEDEAQKFIDFLAENDKLMKIVLSRCKSSYVREVFSLLRELAVKYRKLHQFMAALKLIL